MRALAALCILIYILHQANGISIKDHVQETSRKARDINDPPSIDCKMSAWSQWTPCDPCTNTTHRSRGIEVFGQFKGNKCIQPIGDRKKCIPSTKCDIDPPPVCTSSQWQCESEVCIKKNLRCNEDIDCPDGDISDEEDCGNIRPPCGRSSFVDSYLASQAGKGINILGSDPRMNPFNNKVYNGYCNRIIDPSTLEYNRIPWNVGVLNYETKVEESMSKEMYEDIHSLIKEITHDSTTTVDVGLNFKFSPTEPSSNSDSSEGSAAAASSAAGIGGSAGVDVGVEQRNMIKQISELTRTKKKTFMRVKGRVQLATYRMRQRELEVSQSFLNDVDALPLEYEKGIYFAFLEDYGTHYTKNGRSGGEYDVVYVMNHDEIKNKEYDVVYVMNHDEIKNKESVENLMKTCVEVNLHGTLGKGNLEGGGHVKPKHCKELINKPTDDKTKKGVIENVLITVKGGGVKEALAIKTQLTQEGQADISRYIEWAETINKAPALIYSDPEPIYNAIPLSFPDAQPRRDNLRRALDDYVAEYSVCKCRPCQNGGTVAQIDGECKCLCPVGTDGVACQNVNTALGKTYEQLGNWGCWSAWSGCAEGHRRRTRTCNTQGVPHANCRGDTFSEDYC